MESRVLPKGRYLGEQFQVLHEIVLLLSPGETILSARLGHFTGKVSVQKQPATWQRERLCVQLCITHTNWMDRLKNHLCPCLKDVLKSDCCAMGDAEATTDQRAPD